MRKVRTSFRSMASYIIVETTLKYIQLNVVRETCIDGEDVEREEVSGGDKFESDI